MARLGRRDRGLLSRTNAAGEKVWYVRLWHEGREKRFGSFPTKTKAREFYERAKLEQHEGRFQPEKYHHGGHVLVEELLNRLCAIRPSQKRVAASHIRCALEGLRLMH